MKRIQGYFNSKRAVNIKYSKSCQQNTNIIYFLKSNYKYKRRSPLFNTKSKQRQQNQNQKKQLPADEKTATESKHITKKILFYENIQLDKFLSVFIFIMQRATPSNNKFYLIKNKSNNNRLLTKLIANLKTNNKSLMNTKETNNDEDGSVENHHACKDAKKDTDVNVDIKNVTDKNIHHQHNYNKVLTTISTPIKCQSGRNHQQIKTANSSSSQSPTISFAATATTLTTCTLLSTPSIEKYETSQWTAVLRHDFYDHPSIHHHQYHHKRKQTQHTNSLTSKRVFSINDNRSSTATSPGATALRTSILQSVDQYFNATWYRSHTWSCLLLALFIAFAVGIRSTAAGACWQTVLENGKCNEMFSLNIRKSECCGANQEFAYTEREPTNVEYFFATAIGGGMECSPCLGS